MPARYVVGYAYSSVEQKLIGHTWVEVLAGGEWVSFDPTWLEAGYLDATHIKTAVRGDANQSEILQYRGGTIDWDRNEDEITLLDYKLENTTPIKLQGRNLSFGESGFIRADAASSSCVKRDGTPMLSMHEPERRYWGNSAEIYWFFDVAGLDRNFIYTCPVTVYDQTGSSEKIDVTVSGTREVRPVFISGPDTALVNEKFSLVASADGGIFYSPDLGKNENSIWDLKIVKPGKYTFYLYSGGALAKKTVSVESRKEFSVALSVPSNASAGSNFTAAASVKNLLGSGKSATVKLDYDGKSMQQPADFGPNEQRHFNYTLSSDSAGLKEVSLSVYSDAISAYSTSIAIYEVPKEKGFFESAADSIANFFSGILEWIKSLFGAK